MVNEDGGAAVCKTCWKGFLFEGLPGDYTHMMEHPYSMTKGHALGGKKARVDDYYKEGVMEMEALDAQEGMTPEELEAFGGL